MSDILREFQPRVFYPGNTPVNILFYSERVKEPDGTVSE